MENKTLDLLSKLLASENLTIIRDRVPTASFDIIKRVLRLPLLLNMSTEEETMLAFHEVSHALFTPEDYVNYIKSELKKRPTFSHYINVVEDVRVERLFKEKFPGARKDFFKGYNSFNDRDFFKLSGKNVNTLSLIDRINIFYKVGYSAGVKFTAEERQFITQIESCDTIKEVYEVSIALYDFAASQEKARKENEDQPNSIVMVDEFDFDDEFDGDSESQEMEMPGDESEESEESGTSEETNGPSKEESQSDSAGESEETTGDSQEESDDSQEESTSDTTESNTDKENTKKESSRNVGDQEIAPVSQTQEAFDTNVQVNTSVTGRDIQTFLMEGNRNALLVNHHRIVSDFRNILTQNSQRSIEDKYSSFRVNANKMVAHLVKEFEMRKAAKRYARTQTARTGELSMSKIAQFQINDDLFKKLDIVSDDSNHGFMMMLDWSGSMLNNMQDTLGQVITLASFCRRCNIPFAVYAFSDNCTTHFGFQQYTYHKVDNSLVSGYGQIDVEPSIMFNFFNNKMSNSEFELVAKFLYNGYYRFRMDPRNTNSEAPYSLSGTPLVSALLFAEKNIETFKRSNNVEKMTLITLTDGEGNDTNLINSQGRYCNYYSTASMKFLRHAKTGKSIAMDGETRIDQILINMIRLAHPDLKIIGFFVTDFRLRNMYQYIHRNRLNFGGNFQNRKIAVETQSHGNRDGYYEFPAPGYDKMFFIKSSSVSMDLDLDEIKEDMTSAQIARKFSGSMAAAVKGRVVLTKFIAQIA